MEFYYNGRILVDKGITNSSGILSLRLSAGNYTIRILWRGEVREKRIKLLETPVKVNETLITYDLTVKVISSIFKNPIPAVVILQGKEFTVKAVTSANGTCIITQLPPDTYSIKVISLGTIISRIIELKEDKVVTFTVPYVGETIFIVGIITLLIAIILFIASIVRQRQK